jgi:hypothetical protein
VGRSVVYAVFPGISGIGGAPVRGSDRLTIDADGRIGAFEETAAILKRL